MNRVIIALLATLFATTAQAKTVNYAELTKRWRGVANTPTNKPAIKTSGVINGGGASGMLCTNAAGDKTVRLLDMKELTDLWNLTEMPSDLSDENDAFVLLAIKFANHFWNPWTISKPDMVERYKDVFGEFLSGATFLKPGQDINPIDDVHTPIKDPNCELVQIAMFYNESKFVVDTDLWEQLSWLDRAALIAHEMIYLQARLNGEQDSINTRKFVSYLFSEQGLTPLADPPVNTNTPILKCIASQTDNGDVMMGAFYAYENLTGQGSETIFNFASLNGRATIFRTSVTTNIKLDEMFNDWQTSVEFDLDIDTFPYSKNTLLMVPKRLLQDGRVERTLSLFNQNGVLIGGPWNLRCG